MRELLHKNYIFLQQNLHNKAQVFRFLSQRSFSLGLAQNEDDVEKELLKREKLASTGLLDGIAIPHAISENIKEPAILFVRSREPVEDWSTIDHSKVFQIIAMLVPANSEQEHLQTLANLSGRLIEQKQRKKLAECSTVKEVYDFLSGEAVSG